MMMFGKHNWQIPSALDRLLPRLNVEGSAARSAEPAPAPPPAVPDPDPVAG
jgi:hypothetical protein